MRCVRNTHRLSEFEEGCRVHVVGEAEGGNEHATIDLSRAETLQIGRIFAYVELGVHANGFPVILDVLGEPFAALADVHRDGDAFGASLLEQRLRLFRVIGEE